MKKSKETFQLTNGMKKIIDDKIDFYLKRKIKISYDDFITDIFDEFEKIFPKTYTYKDLNNALEEYIKK